jgi:hypothetical protein
VTVSHSASGRVNCLTFSFIPGIPSENYHEMTSQLAYSSFIVTNRLRSILQYCKLQSYDMYVHRACLSRGREKYL